MFNQDWFAAEWRAAGHDVRTIGFAEHLDVRAKTPLLHIDTIIKNHIPDFVPDRIVFHDNSAPITVLGLDETQIPTVFYSVDTHHHVEYHKYLAHLFDESLIAQRDYLPQYEALGATPEWLPLWASRFVEASSERTHDAVFVGNLDVKLNPGRVKFFDDLRAIVPVDCRVGQYWTIFPLSEVIMNQTVKGDLNFRVFEAMMCGGMLLTERSGNGLFELFKDGEHLVSYTKDDPREAAEKISYYLAHREEARRIGAAGRAEILRAHLSEHRAARMWEVVQRAHKRQSPYKHFGAFVNFTVLARRMEKIDKGFGSRAIIAALRSGEMAMQFGEKITTELAYVAVSACINYDRLIGSGAGACFLEQLGEAFPHEMVLQMARIRARLNQGQISDAEALARQSFGEDVQGTFSNAERVVSSILHEL